MRWSHESHDRFLSPFWYAGKNGGCGSLPPGQVASGQLSGGFTAHCASFHVQARLIVRHGSKVAAGKLLSECLVQLRGRTNLQQFGLEFLPGGWSVIPNYSTTQPSVSISWVLRVREQCSPGDPFFRQLLSSSSVRTGLIRARSVLKRRRGSGHEMRKSCSQSRESQSWQIRWRCDGKIEHRVRFGG